MNSSTTIDQNVLQACLPGRLCENTYWEMVCTAFSALSIIFNFLHIAVLNRMVSLKGKTYLKLLNHISIVDISTSVSIILQINCQLHIASHLKSRMIAVVISVVTTVPQILRYYMFALASYDRYVAICKPLLYDQSKVIRWFDGCVTFGWLFCLVYSTIKDIVFSSDLCLDIVFGANNLLVAEPVSLMAVIFIVFFATSAGFHFQIMVGREMYRMYKRQQVADSQVLRSALYVLIIYIKFIFCLFPVILCLVLSYTKKCSYVLTWISTLMFTSYGTINSLTYGWLSKSYRTEVIHIFRCKSDNVVGFTQA